MLAEMPKEELNQLLKQLITENVIKEDTQGYLFSKILKTLNRLKQHV
nr:hypothetical protein [uncultured Helicobacter sp.]